MMEGLVVPDPVTAVRRCLTDFPQNQAGSGPGRIRRLAKRTSGDVLAADLDVEAAGRDG